ncbi:hypothetical protein MSBRW_0185 [Methanosarcina barkeri str. Wiesmoor]|uniref:Uncharacterized protein n=1 Tax=Methanosarcina barkeri str. Wiesmoor TaxID=1434109 RepID=A0A0E3QHP1_METBA|nr:hypothetical protein MSBRW_0185 [Methanosarcina barkeri str. Wiesmoor]
MNKMLILYSLVIASRSNINCFSRSLQVISTCLESRSTLPIVRSNPSACARHAFRLCISSFNALLSSTSNLFSSNSA